jgi:hypothetical protein
MSMMIEWAKELKELSDKALIANKEELEQLRASAKFSSLAISAIALQMDYEKYKKLGNIGIEMMEADDDRT